VHEFLVEDSLHFDKFIGKDSVRGKILADDFDETLKIKHESIKKISQDKISNSLLFTKILQA